jgi:hypothetical protein
MAYGMRETFASSPEILGKYRIVPGRNIVRGGLPGSRTLNLGLKRSLLCH